MDKNNKILIGVIVVLFIVMGVIAFKILQPGEQLTEQPTILAEQPTIEEANVIFEETMEKTLALDSFTNVRDGYFKVKDGDLVLLKAEIKNMEGSVIDPFTLAKQNSSSVIDLNFSINFLAIADLIEKIEVLDEEMTTKEKQEKAEGLIKMREIGETEIGGIIKMKSIDFNTYMKFVEIRGLEDLLKVSNVIEYDEVEMINEMKANIGIWRKTPANPMVKMMITPIFTKVDSFIGDLMRSYYVVEVLPNAKINGVPVYTFVLSINLGEAKQATISFASSVVTMIEAFGMDLEVDVKAEITKVWPKIETILGTIETDTRSYICQETRFIMSETMTTSLNLAEFLGAIKLIIPTEEMTAEDIAEFNKVKEAVKNINIAGTMNVVYSEHNAVAPILPPAEYEVITPEPEPMPMW